MDMGVWFLQYEAQRQHGQYCDAIIMLVKAMKGGASGGTIASLLNVIRESRQDPSIARVVADPYGLNPHSERPGPDRHDQHLQHHLKPHGSGITSPAPRTAGAIGATS